MQEQARSEETMSTRLVVVHGVSLLVRFLMLLSPVYWLISSPWILYAPTSVTWLYSPLSGLNLIPGYFYFTCYGMIFLSVISMPLAAYAFYNGINTNKLGLQRVTEMSIIICVVALVLFRTTDISLHGIQDETLIKLKDYQPKYNWTVDGDATCGKNWQTIVWDKVQESLQCCGYHGPSEWLPLKPIDLLPEAKYAVTCCVDATSARAQGYCGGPGTILWGSGCSDRIKQTLSMMKESVCLTFLLSFSVALWAGLLHLTQRFVTAQKQHSSERTNILGPYYGALQSGSPEGSGQMSPEPQILSRVV